MFWNLVLFGSSEEKGMKANLLFGVFKYDFSQIMLHNLQDSQSSMMCE